MKCFIFIFGILLNCSIPLFSQITNWGWVKSAGNNFDDQGSATTTDADGNVYVAGWSAGPNITFGNYILTGTIFLIKYDPLGNVSWARSSSYQNQPAYVNGIAKDIAGNLYITGSFSVHYITFGNYTLTNANSGIGYNDIFIAKYDSSGNVLWAKREGCPSTENCMGITTDVACNVYVTGGFSDSMTFESTILKNPYFFIAKYDSSGNVLWAKDVLGYIVSTSITTDAACNTYVTGRFFSDTLIFGSDTLINMTTNYSYNDIFIAKYDSSGNVLWAKSVGGIYDDVSYGISSDVNCNVFLTGAFSSPLINIGGTTLNNPNNSNGSFSDIFITKYDSSGNVHWANRVGGIYSDIGNSITKDPIGNVYISGSFASSIITLGNTTLTNVSTGSSDILVAKFDSSGNALWAKSAGGIYGDGAYSITADTFGNLYITGVFVSPTIVFGSNTLHNTSLSSYDSDFFIAQIPGAFSEIKNINDNNAKLFPNPTTGKFSITITLLTKYIQICNSLGQILEKRNVNNEKEVNFEIKKNGIYFVQIVSGNQSVMKKVIITRE